MLKETPLVSIVVPTYNGRKYIESALASLQAQRDVKLEIVVVDDGSNDGTPEIVENLAAKDSRVTLIHGRFRSIAKSRNEGLRRSTGTLVGFLDHDDLCPDGKIARQVARLIAEPRMAALFGKTVIFASNAMEATNAMMNGQTPRYTMCLSAALFRRHVFDQIGLLDPKFTLADDFDFILRLIESGLTVSLEDHLATLHRRHPDQATADLIATRREAMLAIAESLKRRRVAGNVCGISHPLLSVAL